MAKANLTPEQMAELANAWRASVVKKQDQQTKALIDGINFRVNVGAAFKAAFLTAKFAFTVGKAAAGLADPVELLALPVDIWEIIVTTIHSLVEKMLPLHYVACVVLASSPGGLTSDEFRQQLGDFLDRTKTKKMPWYLALTKARLKDARSAFEQVGAFEKLLEALTKDKWLESKDGKLVFKPRHYTWRSSKS